MAIATAEPNTHPCCLHLPPCSNATFSACADGLPNTVEAEVELGKAALSAFPSCASADLEVGRQQLLLHLNTLPACFSLSAVQPGNWHDVVHQHRRIGCLPRKTLWPLCCPC